MPWFFKKVMDSLLNACRETSGHLCAEFILALVSRADIFSFSRFLQLPSVKNVSFECCMIKWKLLGDAEYSKYYRLLEIFAYGTIGDYFGLSMITFVLIERSRWWFAITFVQSIAEASNAYSADLSPTSKCKYWDNILVSMTHRNWHIHI